MSWIRKLQIGAVFFIGFVILIAFYSFILKESDEQKLLNEAKAEIVKVEPKISRESDGMSVSDKIQTFTVTYRYELNEQKIERNEDLSRNAYKIFKVGENAKVCYNPQNPSEIKLFLNSHICGK